MKDLFLIIDTSGSMKQSVGDGTSRSYLDCCKEAALDFLSHWDGDGKVELCSCSAEHIRPIPTSGLVGMAVSAIRGLTAANVGGATKRWDAMMKHFKDKVRACETQKCPPCTVVLFTDNDDDASTRYNLEDLQELFDATPHASFHLTTYSQTTSSMAAEPPVTTLESDSAQDALGLADRDRAVMKSMYVPPAPVLSAIACTATLRDTVVECMPDILRHLQGRSGLNYSPVLTILIDRHSMQSLNPAVATPPLDPQLRFDLQEMLRLLSGTALNFYMQATDEFRQGNRACHSFAEYVAGRLIDYLEKSYKVDREWRLDGSYKRASESDPQVFGNDFSISNVLFVTMEVAGEWLRQAADGTMPLSQPDMIAERYLEDYGRIIIGGEKRREFDLDCWQRRLPHKQWKNFESQFGKDGRLIKDMESLSTVHDITLAAVKRLLPKVMHPSEARFVSEIRSYGFYLPPQSSEVERILADCGLPAHFAFSSSGFVFVCIEDCAALAKQLADDCSRGYPEALRNILTTVLTHEHGHAIIHQGSDPNEHPPGSQQAIIRSHPAEEALAEWFELDAFRGDPIMTESIHSHASSGGSFPSWPYAGALIIERFDSSMDFGGQAFIRLLKLYRRGESDRVAELIKKWRDQNSTTNQDLMQKKKEFLNRYNPSGTIDKAIARSIAAAVQHNSLYRPNITRKGKEPVICAWGEFLKSLIPTYEKARTVADYDSDILKLKMCMNQLFPVAFYTVLHPKYNTDPGFRISHAQKSISVFLKHLWCMGLIVTPPQCPVDSIILRLAGKRYPDTNWGYVNTIKDHGIKIGYLLAAQNNSVQPLAEWELEKFEAS